MQAESSAGLAERQQIAQHLLKAQRTSGGWAQRPEWPSDDYGTGMSLWVLNEAGILRSDDPRFRRGARFLVSTQSADGSWHVVSRAARFQPYFESRFPYGRDQ